MSELDYWKARLLRGAVSRREFMGRAAALGASGLAISGMLASADALAAETPRNGGVLRLGLAGGSTTDSLEPASWTNSVMIDVGNGVFDGLVEWGQNGKPLPALAESFEPKNGAKDLILNLRKGIKFSNGQEFNADDAVYSLNLHRGATKSGAAGPMKEVSDIKKLDKYQIQISLADARRGFSLHPNRLPSDDGPGRLQGLGKTGRHRGAGGREVRSRRADHAQEATRLLEGGPRPSRRRGGDRHQRQLSAPQCA